MDLPKKKKKHKLKHILVYPFSTTKMYMITKSQSIMSKEFIFKYEETNFLYQIIFGVKWKIKLYFIFSSF